MDRFLERENGNVAIYGVVTCTGLSDGVYTYTVVDDYKNILTWQSETQIAHTYGNCYFAVEGKIKQHIAKENQTHTVLFDCDCELVGQTDTISGLFFGNTDDVVDLGSVKASYRRVYGDEWILNGEYAICAPKSQYRMIIEKDYNVFMLPYDSLKRLDMKSRGKFMVNGRVIGYRVEKNTRITFLYPISVEDKNEPLYAGRRHGRFLTGLRR